MEKLFDNKLILIGFVVVALLIIGAVVYNNQMANKEISQSEEEGEILPAEQVSEKVISFINQNLLTGSNKASLIDTLKENGLYKITFVIGDQTREIEVYASLDGELFFPEVIDLTEVEEKAVQKGTTVGNFSVSDDPVCEEDGKPIIYFFGSENCGFCQWEHPIVEKVAEKFTGEISFHNNMDSDDDREIFQKYSTGGIPTMVFGCKYYKVGAGQANGEEGEERNLTALICKLTGNKPADVCDQVQDLVNQITS